MNDECICFPLALTGYWHNGVHIFDEEYVIQKYLAYVCAIRNSEFQLSNHKSLCELITELEYSLLSDEEKIYYAKSNDDSYYKLKETISESIIKSILKKLNLYSSNDFVLFKHQFYNEENVEKIKFFSLYMHLDHILNTPRSNVIKYCSEKDSSVSFPHITFATAGAAERNEMIYQVEYFMDKKNAQIFFQNERLFFPGNECYKIDGKVQLFSLNSQTEMIKRSYLKNTIFEIKEFPNEEKYPNIVKVKPYLLPCIIYRDDNTLQLQEEKINLRFTLNIFEFLTDAKIGYLLSNEYISKTQTATIRKYKYLKIESINNIPYQKDINLCDLICGHDFRELSKFETCFINNHALNFDNNEFYVDLNRSPFKEVYFDKRCMFLLTKDINLETMKYNPCLYKATARNEIIIDNSLKIPCNKIYFNNGNIKYDLNEKTYFRFSDNLYYYLDTKKDIFVCPNDYFTFVSSDDLAVVDKETDIQKKKEKLREIFDEKSKIKNKSYIEGAFEHPSEWHEDVAAYSKLGFKQSIIKKYLAIWDKNYSNESLPDEIKNCSKFTFFYKSQFETFLSSLHNSYAEKLIKIQDIVMNKYSYKQGNLGLYKNVFGFNSNNTQTFCNHAVFETIVRVDGNFNAFTKNDKLKKNTNRDPLKEKFPECPNISKYPFKPSNYWCDVLKEQSENSSQTGIFCLSAEQAFYMAQLGYVVIAAWKNLSKNGSPHFVTVRPCEEEYLGIKLLKVAHVGGGGNMEKNLAEAFGGSGNNGEKKIREVLFYCNIKQCFI